MEITLLTGTEAVEAAGTPGLLTDWLGLQERCPWATGCQHPDFVLPWYRLYGGRFLPVLVLGRSAQGRLEGLLALAKTAGACLMTGAGDKQAEYHGWLADPGDGDAFIRTAMARVHARFPGVDLRLKYLAPGTPLGWTNGAGELERHCVLRAHRRPLMHIDAAAMARQRNKKANRQNFNRLGRIGELVFEQVCDAEHFARVFDDICLQYDFRQGALYQQRPFHADPAKKLFFLELHRRGLLHATILTVGGELAASHLGLVSRGRAVHLGINTHAPAFAPHSPGKLLLAMLGVHLAQEGMPLLDLTPGGDPYKEHLATGYDLVFELALYANARHKLQTEVPAAAARWVKAGLRAAGYRPADLRAAADALDRGWRTGIRSGYGRLRSRRPSVSGQLHCRLGAATRRPHGTEVARNQVADLLCYDAGTARLGYWQFLRQAMQRMERSYEVYSLVRNGKLLVCCWVGQATAAEPVSPQQPSLQPSNSIRLFDLYVHPELAGSECLRSFLEGLTAELQRGGREGLSYSATELHPKLRQAFVDSGFADTSGQGTTLPTPFETPRLWEPGS